MGPSLSVFVVPVCISRQDWPPGENHTTAQKLGTGILYTILTLQFEQYSRCGKPKRTRPGKPNRGLNGGWPGRRREWTLKVRIRGNKVYTESKERINSLKASKNCAALSDPLMCQRHFCILVCLPPPPPPPTMSPNFLYVLT
jgi:hypothetical protein